MSKVVATLAVSAVAVITIRVVLSYLQIRLYFFLAMSVRPSLVVLPDHFADFAHNLCRHKHLFVHLHLKFFTFTDLMIVDIFRPYLRNVSPHLAFLPLPT